MAISFLRPALIEFDGNPVSDHNREPVGQEEELFKNDVRTVNATLRRQDINTKKQFTVTWNLLPGEDTETVDGFWGADSLRNFYANNHGNPFVLTIYETIDDAGKDYTVMFDEFSSSLQHRWNDQFLWEVSLGVVEV